MAVFLKSLGIGSYRGIGENVQRMRDFREINFFIGSNNSGKSTVLNYISKHLSSSESKIDPLERHELNPNLMPIAEFGISVEQAHKSIVDALPNVRADGSQGQILKRLLENVASDDGWLWFSRSPKNSEKILVTSRKLDSILTHNEWQHLWIAVTHYTGGGGLTDWISGVLGKIGNSVNFSFPKANLIPAIREISARGDHFADYTGARLIDKLAEIQNPGYDQRSNVRTFAKINSFLESVTDEAGSKIEIPHDREHILVHMNGRVLPLAALGTGIHEVVMIAAFCTLSHNEIVCIEEPELHLHPLMQRKLISYLRESTNNQYFIATHSSVFIDTPGSAVFHVKIKDRKTTITRAEINRDKHDICVDLGYRPSDFIQTNAVVWVEGPSDRIYLKHWLRSIAPDLIEGTHYSLMFYGGRLLSHLSASDDLITDFIQLRSLNRNVAVVIDSDRERPHARINATKTRIVNEIGSHGGIAWITKGREIENYVPHDQLQAAVQEVAGARYGGPSGIGQFDHALSYVRAGNSQRAKQSPVGSVEAGVDKVRVARLVCAGEADLDILDLRKQVNILVAFIRKANR